MARMAHPDAAAPRLAALAALLTRHVLHRFDYAEKDTAVVGEPDPLIAGPASRLFEQSEMDARLLTTGRAEAGPTV